MVDTAAHSAAGGAVSARNEARALALMREMRARDLAPNVITYSAAISACEKAARWKSALALLVVMRRTRVLPDEHSFNGAILACGRAGAALSTLRTRLKVRAPPPTWLERASAHMACTLSSRPCLRPHGLHA